METIVLNINIPIYKQTNKTEHRYEIRGSPDRTLQELAASAIASFESGVPQTVPELVSSRETPIQPVQQQHTQTHHPHTHNQPMVLQYFNTNLYVSSCFFIFVMSCHVSSLSTIHVILMIQNTTCG